MKSIEINKVSMKSKQIHARGNGNPHKMLKILWNTLLEWGGGGTPLSHGHRETLREEVGLPAAVCPP